LMAAFALLHVLFRDSEAVAWLFFIAIIVHMKVSKSIRFSLVSTIRSISTVLKRSPK
jgi:hypothetical protein